MDSTELCRWKPPIPVRSATLYGHERLAPALTNPKAGKPKMFLFPRILQLSQKTQGRNPPAVKSAKQVPKLTAMRRKMAGRSQGGNLSPRQLSEGRSQNQKVGFKPINIGVFLFKQLLCHLSP